jgi:hypothetical protein
MRLRTFLISAFSFSFLLSFLIPAMLWSQGRTTAHVGHGLLYQHATGQQTGHLLDLGVYNDTDSPLEFSLPSSFIPSDGQVQGRLTRSVGPLRIEPGEMKVVPVYGFCTDVMLPARKAGPEPIPIDHWIPINEGKAEQLYANLDNASGIRTTLPYPKSNITIINPYTGVPVQVTWNKNEALGTMAILLGDALQRIETTILELQRSGKLSTPFSDPKDEQEVLTQQALWMYSTGMEGEKYEKADFSEQMSARLTDITGTPEDQLAEADQHQFEEEVNSIWANVSLVGEEAKLFDIPETSEPTETEPTPTEQPEEDLQDSSRIEIPIPPGHRPSEIPDNKPQQQPDRYPLDPPINWTSMTFTEQAKKYPLPELPRRNKRSTTSEKEPTQSPLEDFPEELYSKGRKGPKVEGTGRTTGHVLTISVKNPTEKTVVIPPKTVLIPPTGTFQSMIASLEETVVPGQSEMEIPVYGSCLDIRARPVQIGNYYTPIQNWLDTDQLGEAPTPNDELSPVWVERYPGMEYGDGSNPVLAYPGTDIPFPYTIDFNRHFTEAAPLLLEISNRIQNTFTEMWTTGQIETPLPPDQARIELPQQVLWYTNSLLEGQPYTREDLNDRMVQQIENRLGKPITTLPQEVQDNFRAGVDQIWEVIEVVAQKAEVTTTAPKPTQSIPKSSCDCSTCELAGPIEVWYLDKDGIPDERVTGDTLITGRQIQLRFPEARSDCPPTDCIASFQIDLSRYTEGKSELLFLAMIDAQDPTYELMPPDDPGPFSLAVRATCFCKKSGRRTKQCGQTTQDLDFIMKEGNPCCEEFRVDGALRFNVYDGDQIAKVVLIRSNDVFVYDYPGWKRETHAEFSLNLEAILCNLEEARVTSEVINQGTPGVDDEGGTTAQQEFENASFAGPHPESETGHPPMKALAFSKSIFSSEEGVRKEISFAVHIEEGSCDAFLSLTEDGERLENVQAVNREALQNAITSIQSGNYQSPIFWARIRYVLSQIMLMSPTQQQSFLIDLRVAIGNSIPRDATGAAGAFRDSLSGIFLFDMLVNAMMAENECH